MTLSLCPHRLILSPRHDLHRVGDTDRPLVALWRGANHHPCWSDGSSAAVGDHLYEDLYSLCFAATPLARWLKGTGAMLRASDREPGIERLVLCRRTGRVWLADAVTARAAVALQRVPDTDAA